MNEGDLAEYILGNGRWGGGSRASLMAVKAKPCGIVAKSHCAPDLVFLLLFILIGLRGETPR